MKKVHIVNHTHWDREWYFTSGDSLVLSEQLFTDIIDELEKNNDVSFVLDGQISILDDYLKLYPNKIDRVKKLIKEKRLHIGPWFTQTDAFFARGESILRNLMVGVYETKKYGDYMKIGYLPDTFGFNAQMPTILRHVGFDNIIFWRGINLGKQVNSPYFKWKTLSDKNYIYAINMPHGYGTGMLLEPSEKFVNGRLDPAVDFISKYKNTDEILIPSGNDQLNIISEFKHKVEKINDIGKYSYITSTYQEFLEYVKSRENLDTYKGEFREPSLARIHKSIGSSRMDIKLASDGLENKLIKRIEPLLVIAKKCNISISNQLLIDTWKKLLEGQAHDSLGGCVTDTVTSDILHRMKEASEICDSIENTICKKIAEALKVSKNEIIVFNTDAKKFNGYKEIKVITSSKNIEFEGYKDATIIEGKYINSRDNILQETPAGNIYIEELGYYILKIRIKINLPALGYKIIRFNESKSELKSLINVNDNFIENNLYKISFEDESLNLTTSSSKSIKDFISLKDSGNAGDTYDFSPLENDKEIKIRFNKIQIEKSDSYQRMLVEGTTSLPLTLKDRSSKNNNGELKVKLSISISKDNPKIDLKVSVDNTIYNHRLRIHIKSNINTNKNIASLPFGYIKREKGVTKDWKKNYSEMPIDLEPLEGNISLSDNEGSLTVFTKGIKEYQHIDDEIALTLLATTDELGKPNLIYRPGRASGDTTKKSHVRLLTPSAQLIKKLSYSLAIYLSDKPFDEFNVAKINNKYLMENTDYQLQDYNFFIHRIDNKIQKSIDQENIKAEVEILSLPDECLVSACYLSYYCENKFVVRIENPTNNVISLDKKIFVGKNAKVINALEDLVEQIYEIDSYDVKSILLDL